MPYPPCGMGHSRDAHPIRFDRRFRSAAVLIVLIACVPMARADQTPRTGVIDDAGVVRPETINNINAWLLELEQKTGAQMKVWTIDTTNGRDIYTLGIETARKWKLGQKKDNNGCLIVIAVNDRKWRIITAKASKTPSPTSTATPSPSNTSSPTSEKATTARAS